MALNLRKKIPESDTLSIFDVNPKSTQKFVDEAGSKGVYIASDPKDLAQKSVCNALLGNIFLSYMMIVLFYL